MKILIFTWKDLTHPLAGGAEVYTAEVARAWADQGHAVTWFCAAVDGQPAQEVSHGVNIIRRGGRLGVYAAARRWYAGQPPLAFDLVIDEVNTRPFLARRWVRDVPVVALIFQVCREIWWQEMPLPVAFVGRFVLERHWLATYRDTRVLTISESSRASLADYGLGDVSVVPVGIAPATRPTVTREARPTMLFVGRLASNKRPGDAVEAFRIVRKSLPDAQLWVVGTGPLHDALAKGAPPGVTFHGRVDEETKHNLMARAHALVVTSVREGWGLVVDEAAAMGTRAITYDVAGLRDSAVAAAGRLVQASPEALGAACVALLPTWAAEPEATGWTGGAVSWPDVARAILKEAGVTPGKL